MGLQALSLTIVGSLCLSPFWYSFEYIIGFLAVPIAQANKLSPQMEGNVRKWLRSGFSHLLQLLIWFLYVFGGESWILHPWSYHETTHPRHAEAVANRGRVLPVYIMYLAYAWHSFFKDSRRAIGRLSDPMQAMFLFHHILTIFLVAVSLDSNNYRAGVLTRLALEPSDLGVYLSKISTPVYDAGNLPYSLIASMYVANITVWTLLRVVFYAFVNYQLTVMCLTMDSTDPSATVTWVLLVGQWVMWTLQVIWMVAIGDVVQKFVRSGKTPMDAIDKGQQDAQTEIPKSKGPSLDAMLNAATDNSELWDAKQLYSKKD